jgi:hypothetical protein
MKSLSTINNMPTSVQIKPFSYNNSAFQYFEWVGGVVGGQWIRCTIDACWSSAPGPASPELRLLLKKLDWTSLVIARVSPYTALSLSLEGVITPRHLDHAVAVNHEREDSHIVVIPNVAFDDQTIEIWVSPEPEDLLTTVYWTGLILPAV